MAIEDQVKINLNQNLWGLVVSYAALGMAEHWHLSALFALSLCSSGALTISVIVTFTAYTINYWKDKL